MADQQYCLRWNNHQTTLISVFESLQERGCMVDCTLAAEGQSLQAHKVVLSACSPYLEDLLSKHYDKHPILLLKDVKFEELKAMMDYMYRGEVNVAQDKLNTFLRAAESLQIKGLSDGGTDPPDSGGTGSMKRTAKGAPVSVRSNQQLTVRTTNLADDNSSRDGSVSPSLRKRRRRRGSDGSDHDNSSNVADGKQSSAAAAPVTGPTVINEDMLPTVPASGPSDDNLLSSILESTETENATDSGITSANNTVPLQENVIRDRDNVLIEPKTEYLDDDAQDLHLDDDDSMFRAGPSHARGSGNYEGDDGEDVYMANQDSGANAQGVASFLRAQGTEVWVEGSAAAAEEEVQEVPQAPALRAPLCRSAASTAVWVQETPRPASRTSTASAVAAAAVALKAVPHVAAEVGAEASRDAGPEVSSAVIEVSMDDLEESDVWNALVKDEPDGSEDIEADFEADIEAEVELEEGDADELSSAADESVSPGRLGRRRTYKCRVCRKHMGSMSILQRHMVTHTDEERKQQPFARQCEQCGRVLSSRQRLESHINAVHMQGDKKQSSYVRQSLGCPVCGKVLSSMQRVRSHMATHYRNPMAMPTPPATPLQPAPEDAVFKHVV